MKELLESWKRFLVEKTVYPVFHGSSVDIDVFDISKTRDFGFHFGTEETARHRSDQYVKRYSLSINNPIKLNDIIRWDAKNIIEDMLAKGYINEQESVKSLEDIKTNSRKSSKENGTPLRVEENMAIADFLTSLGYDAIEYENKGESGGLAYIVWNPSQITEVF